MRIWFLVFILLVGCTTPRKVREVPPPIPPAEPPKSAAKKPVAPKPTLVLNHGFFEVHYDKTYRLARYVRYTLTRENLRQKVAKRKESFRADDKLRALNVAAVEPTEYQRTGYDRGHLAPAADFAWNPAAMDATFVMSNMVPQKPGLNRSAWKQLEDQVRRWACGEEKIQVITGPVLKENLPRLPSGLPVPEEFFKVVIDETPPRKALAFIYHQNDRGAVMADRQVELSDLDRRLRENFSALVTDNDRQPTEVADWKECVP